MAEDDYNYDFSDEESEEKVKADRYSPEKDDEQQMQKINGLVETYQQQLSDIQASLEKEREAHQTTRKSLTASPANEAAELQRQLDSLREEHAEEKNALEKELAHARNSSATGSRDSLSTKMRRQVDNLCKAFAVEPPYLDVNEMTEKQCLDLLAIFAEKGSSKGKSSSPAKRSATPVEQDSDLHKRIMLLEEELRLALGAAEDIRALKSKVIQLVERLRIEKEDKIAANAEVKRYSRKMEMLGDHIEKLMLHLKHEAGTKIKVSDQLRDSEKRNGVSQEKITNLSKKLGAKDRLISELREGSKILEDQLRLMDEKYLELRTKLDYTRDTGAKKIKKAQKMASELRVKFALAGNSTLLDHMPLPQSSMANTAPSGGIRGNNSDSFDYQGHELNSLKGPGTTGGGKHTKRKSGGKGTIMQQGSAAWEQPPPISDEDNELRVLEKVRKLQGGKTEWTDEKIKELLQKK